MTDQSTLRFVFDQQSFEEHQQADLYKRLEEILTNNFSLPPEKVAQIIVNLRDKVQSIGRKIMQMTVCAAAPTETSPYRELWNNTGCTYYMQRTDWARGWWTAEVWLVITPFVAQDAS